ncbi:MAG: multidrug effflux MFS transporter [Steroidobacteraceae bacterium]|nr:multidrug effflux MFS transporter [Steroidobacteraceae bacterium]
MTEAGPPAPQPLADRSLIVLLAAIAASGPFAMNVYLPALPVVQAHFGATVPEMNTTVSIALLSFAVGILLHGPLSDRYGRRPVILGGLGVFALGNLLCLVAPTLEVLLAGRAVQSFGSAAGLVVARAMLGDLYAREKMARMLAYLTMVMVVGPTVAPLIGGAVTDAWGWKSLFAVLLMANAAVLGFTWRHLPETRAAGERSASKAALLGESFALLRRRAFLGLAVQAGVIYATFLAFISIVPYVMVELGRSSTEYGLWYLLLAGGYFVGNWWVTRVATRVGLRRLIVAGTTGQLVFAALGLGLMLAGIWHPAAIFIPFAALSLAQGLALPNLNASAVALAPRTAGAASSMLGFSQQFIGASAVQFMALFSTQSPVPIYVFCAVVSVVAWISLYALPHGEVRPQAAG